MELTYKMVDHSHEEIEEQWRPTLVHLVLHGTTTLECVTAADDERKIVCTKFRVASWRVGIREASGCQDGTALNARLKALLFESETLKFRKVVAVSRALYMMLAGCRQL